MKRIDFLVTKRVILVIIYGLTFFSLLNKKVLTDIEAIIALVLFGVYLIVDFLVELDVSDKGEKK